MLKTERTNFEQRAYFRRTPWGVGLACMVLEPADMTKTFLRICFLAIAASSSACGAAADSESADAEDVGTEEAAAAPRLHWFDDSCHTFGFLMDRANQGCSEVFHDYAYNFNFTHGCSGWWGSGAKSIWYSCGNN